LQHALPPLEERGQADGHGMAQAQRFLPSISNKQAERVQSKSRATIVQAGS